MREAWAGRARKEKEEEEEDEEEERAIMSKALYRAMLKLNVGKIIGYASGNALYGLLLTTVYPSIAGSPAAAEIAGSFPATVKSVFGVSDEADLSTFESYISGQFFSRIWVLVMSVYGIGTAQSLLADLLERGFLAYPLAAPLSRREIALTQSAVLLTGCATLTGVTLLGVTWGCHRQGIGISLWRYYRLGILGFSFFSALASYSLFFSAVAPGRGQALFWAAGLTLLFYGLDVVAGLSDKFRWLRRLTLFRFFRPQEILTGQSSTRDTLILLGITAGMLVLTAEGFNRRDLPV
ncbi:ABC-2 family transporter protein [Acididesulfobacillus acetoxydans]|uniref:ABC-2 family transporter protein n=1 Tax=Acididesulfobacillus acetoxydans TaxID=1561005 RepID=A0A8S0W769_9FIRM|nr:ABC transporter permease subunit [Acididesulfobacillus acetoxydans]CAA7600419.1 ABC-2 family transporter protein [Acididesulfobacillus acetoxydans]CEJ06553.1 Hypothetical protein DEACI_1002 [Acididesulfobacillus acetoxydans]